MSLTAEQLSALRKATVAGAPNKLRLARTLVGLNQQEAAKRIGIQPPNLSDFERGDYKDLLLETARRFADFFGCRIEDLFPARDVTGAGHPTLPFGRERQAAAR